jgi:hypothetical protein
MQLKVYPLPQQNRIAELQALICSHGTVRRKSIARSLSFRGIRPIRLAYQPPASSTFLSEQTSHHQSASITFF